jgi:hypothetical protein
MPQNEHKFIYVDVAIALTIFTEQKSKKVAARTTPSNKLPRAENLSEGEDIGAGRA